MTRDTSSSAAQLVGKSLLDGRYAVSGVLGEGSQGCTLEAIDKRDGTLVAIKRFSVRGARSWKDVELAEREARVLARLSHHLLPSAVTHFEEEGALYLVMERIEGRTVRDEDGLRREDVVRFLFDADEVLHYLHNQAPPVIHRDIKPSNVIRRPDGEGGFSYVLVDFGSVRDTLKPAGGSTVVGTFGFMAPEQFQGRARPQSDVFAVGATAITMLTGSQPEDLPHKGLAIDVRRAIGDDDAMASVLERLLEPDPDIRPTRIFPLLHHFDEGPPDDDEREDDRERRGSPKEPPSRRKEGRNSRKERKRQRREAKRERRERRRRERESGDSAGSRVPPLVLPIVVLGLAIARVAVSVSMRVLVPTLLTLLSLVFGKGLRQGAKAVRSAGATADDALHRATLYVMGRSSPPPQEGENGPRVRVDAGPRVEVDEDNMRSRVRDAAATAEDEVAAALEEVAQELDALRDKPKRRHKEKR